MAEGYSWNYARRDTRNRLPGPEHLGWWAAVAMILSIMLHVLVFVVLERMEIALSFQQARELSTGNVNVQRVEVRPMDEPARMDPEKLVQPPTDSATLLEEVDLLAALPKDQELEMRPDLDQASYALQMKREAAAGETRDLERQVPADIELESDLPDIGGEAQVIMPPALGQVTIDPGLRDAADEMKKFTDDLLKQGSEAGVDQGALDGVASLDAMLDLPPNILLSKKTMLPSDLLFAYNQAELRESAKVGLMKLALLMDRNPALFCWIEGHTDLIGGDAFNRELSLRRAEAVKSYLVDSLRMDDERIITRGLGRSQPLVEGGDAAAQAPNRRVEIKMRKEAAAELPAAAASAPGEVQVAPSAPEEVPVAKPVLIKPRRALPVDILEGRAPVAVPVAEPVRDAGGR